MKGWKFMYLDIPEIMTFKECKDILKVGKNTLLDLIHSRELDAFKIGNRWKITRESVEEFIRHR
jgi:excisionase family DNA binding protein